MNKKSGFVSTILLLIITLIALRYIFHIDILSFLEKYINKESLKNFDSKIVYYFKLIGEVIVNWYFKYIHPFVLKFLL